MVTKDKSQEVLLVFPGRYKSPNPQVPLSLLHLASFLRDDGFKVRIFDMRLENFHNFKMTDPLFVGISSMSGLQIRHGLEFARKARAAEPSCPIVWGGVHPTLLPEQTVASENVDVVVRGEGESTILELARRLSSNEPLDDVPSITYMSDGRIRSNPDGQLIDLDTIPEDLAYDLVPLERYPSFQAGRFHMQTSRGCPHRCGFCYNSIFNRGKWRGKSPEKVLNDIEHVTEKFPNIKCIDLIDDNFFVDEKRVEQICRRMINRRMRTTWRANCRFDYMAHYDREFVGLLEKSGCTELNFGAETGSDRLLSLINKDLTTDHMVRSAENLRNWAPSIEPYAFWMSGLPTETEEDLKKTFAIMDRLSETNSKMQHIEICMYTPFPSPILDLFGSEFKLPETLEEWGNIDIFHRRPPWHSKKYVDMLESISATTRYAFYPEDRINEFGFGYRMGYKVLNKMAKYRWRHKYFGLPIELKIISAVVRKVRGY
jgi:anaerobic magnesium-protoporphyrin IX monomethyl ester cyclase